MRVSRAVLCLATWSLAAGAVAQPAPARDAPARDIPPAATGNAIIRGRVSVSGKRPLSRVEVRAVCPPLKINKAVLTDGDGRYEIADLPAGRYIVTFSRAGYVRASYGQRRPLGPGTPIDAANGQTVTLTDAALQRAGVITGRIVDEFGDPMPNVQVMPMRYAFINNQRRMQLSGPMASTNDLGEYRLFGLTPGRYFLSALFRNFNAAAANDRASYAPTYYPGTGNVADAKRLMVAAGQTLPSIDMTLTPVAAARVSGTAYDSRGRPFEGALVHLGHVAGAGVFGSNSSSVGIDGSFSIGGVTPGDYILRANLPNTPEEIATADITVSAGDVSGIQLVASKPATLSGRVVFEAGGAEPPAFPMVRFSVLHPDSNSAATIPNLDSPKDDGTFEIKTNAGRTIIRAAVFGSAEWRLKRVVSGKGIDVTDDGLDVPPASKVDGLVVELTSRPPELSGKVVDAAGARVRDCVVVLFAQDQRRWASGTRYLAIVRPDEADVFHARVPAGDYYAAAFELDEPSILLNDPEILRQLRDRATTLSIGTGEKKTLTLTLGEPPVY
jgi:hypothetical protein